MSKKYFYVFILPILLVTIDCHGGASVSQIQTMWKKVVNSQNPREEKENIEKVREYITGKSVFLNVIVIDSQGNEIKFNDLKKEDKISSIRITFNMDEGQYKVQEWSPKDIENFYILFLE